MSKHDPVKASIVQAAENLFQRWGIRKTTMEDIAREAGKGKSTLYYYFKNKEDVLDEVAEVQIIRIFGRIESEIGAKNTAREKLLTYFRSMFQEIRRALTLFEIATGEIQADRTLIDRTMHRFEAREEKILDSILRSGIGHGEFKTLKDRDIKPTVRAIITVKRSLTINLFIDAGDKNLIDRIIKLLSEGL